MRYYFIIKKDQKKDADCDEGVGQIEDWKGANREIIDDIAKTDSVEEIA